MPDRALTDEQVEECIELYKDGFTFKELGNRFDVDPKTTWKWVKKKSDVKTSKQMTQEEIKEAKNLYRKGWYLKDIANKLDYSYPTISKSLKKNGIELRSHSEYNRIYDLDNNAFEKLNGEASYWIGFIMADGCVYRKKNRTDKLEICLGKDDKEHLNKFKNFLNTEKPLYNYGHGNIRLQVSSTKIVDRLEHFGIVPNKSTNEDPKDINNKNFWRGMVDGDGYIGVTDYSPRIELCGSYQVCGKFKLFCTRFCNSDASIYKAPNKDLYSWATSGSYAMKVLDRLYSEANIYLNRKYKEYLYCREAYNGK